MFRTAISALLLLAAGVYAADKLEKTVSDVDGYSGYKLLFRTGDQIAGSELPIATLIDYWGNPIRSEPDKPTCTSLGCFDLSNLTTSDYEISANPDFISIHQRGDKVFVAAQFEAPNPAVLYIVEASQADDGTLTPVRSYPTDWSAWGGLWVPCAGSVTPWDSHATGEEYEPDAFCVDIATSLDGNETTSLLNCTGDSTHITDYLKYWGIMGDNVTLEALKKHFNPYRYGFGAETMIDADGNATVMKHYTLGRHSYEMWMVMPDNKTVYATDDGANTAFWKFVMDSPGDLSAGTLYGGKFIQQSAEYGGTFDIEWIELGSGTQDEINGIISNNVTFTDIFEYQEFDVEEGCPEGYTPISKRDNNMGAYCLMLKPGMEQAAAFLESRRYLAYLNGTVEFNKWEGISYDADTKTMYTAISVVAQGMEDNMSKGKNSTKYDEGGPNDIRLEYNPCGCVYAVKVDDDMNAISMTAELCGAPAVRGADTCDNSLPAEPDNVAVIDGQGAIIIGEDTNANQNDVMWLYVPATRELTRILSSPYGAETTSPYYFPDINGHAYIMTAMQHPYEERDMDKAFEAEMSGMSGWCGAWAVNASNFANGERLRFVGIPAASTNAEKHSVLAADTMFKLMGPDTYIMIDANSSAEVVAGAPGAVTAAGK